MVLDAFLEHLSLNNNFVTASVRKGQKCPVTPAPIRDTFGSAKMYKLIEAVQDDASLIG
jgi:hypothetical protein